MMYRVFLHILCAVLPIVLIKCETKTLPNDDTVKLPEFLSEVDFASLEASEEDVEALKNVVKRLAPEKNGEYQVYQDVSGQPGIDFPALTNIPATSFSCRGLKGGYYADLETNCQVFHICDNGRKISFLCPNGTIFQQSQLICDWWFKVDCSKSAELYEQSAEQLAEEERRRIEFKKMNSEFHRDSENRINSNLDRNTDYSVQQNGRSNPYGQSTTNNKQNQYQDARLHLKNNHEQNRDINQILQNNNINHQSDNNEQTLRGSSSNNYRQQNGILNEKNDKNKQNINNLNRGFNKYYERGSNYNSQERVNKNNDNYHSNSNANGDADEKYNTRTFTRNNFNQPIQKVTPSYTETTTFRTSTPNPIKEFQQLAESASFTSRQGMRYNKAYSSNQFNAYYNNKASSADNLPKSTLPQSKEGSSQATTRTTVSQFPGPTYTPIFKPRIISTTPRGSPVTRSQDYKSTNQQRNKGNSNYYTNEYRVTNPTTHSFERTTLLPNSATQNNINNVRNEYNNNNNNNNHKNHKNINSDNSNERNGGLNYQAAESITERYQKSSKIVAASPQNGNSYEQRTTNYYNQRSSAKSPEINSSHLKNYISSSTERPSRNEGKETTTLGPYVPFTKNYVYSMSTSTTTAKPPVYTPTVPTYRNNLKNVSQKNKASTTSVSSSYSSVSTSSNRATYLPKKTTPISHTTPRSILDNRPKIEKEHVLNMLQSLKGLEGTVPTLIEVNDKNRLGLIVPNSAGPGTLHSLALYFAAAANDSNTITNNNVNNKNNSLVKNKDDDISSELPTSILTQHTINSYAELFNLNNALENNLTSFDESEDEFNNEDSSDLELQQSAGPLNGAKKSNSTKLRELAQVFTQALSAYLQDPETFKRVLMEIRPTEPTKSEETDTTTVYFTTTEEYPSVTKEKGEVLDFSDDINAARKRQPTTIYPEVTSYSTVTDSSTTDIFSTSYTNEYDSTESSEREKTNDFAFHVNNAFNDNIQNKSNSLYNDYDSYFPFDLNKNKYNNSQPYGKNVQPHNATPISDNYIVSSTPSSYDLTETSFPSYDQTTDNSREDLSISNYQNLQYNAPTTSNYNNDETTSTTPTEPFRIQFFGTTQKNDDETLIAKNNVYRNYRKGYNDNYNLNKVSQDTKQSRANKHWTSSPTVTQLWESTVFVDPQHINRGLTDGRDAPNQFNLGNSLEVNDTVPLKTEFFTTDSSRFITTQNFVTDSSTPWQWVSNNNDSPTAFTLLPPAYASDNTEFTTTDSPTTVSSFIINKQNANLSNNSNITNNEIRKAKEIFGNLNESSSNALMQVMKQADNNITVRQLVLLLINHCNGPMNKTMEEEKEHLLNALLKLPVSEFSSEESKDIIAGIRKISLPIGKSNFKLEATSTASPVTTYRSKKEKRYKTSTDRPPNSRKRSDEIINTAESNNSVLIQGTTLSDNRALELLRSLYSIAAKWG